MRFLEYTAIQAIASLNLVTAADQCKTGNITSIAIPINVNDNKWITDILGAVSYATNQFTIAGDVATAINQAYQANNTLSSVNGTRDTNVTALTTGASFAQSVTGDCQADVFELAKILHSLKTEKYIPSECFQPAVSAALMSNNNAFCLNAIGDAIAEFENASTTTFSRDSDLLGRISLIGPSLCKVSELAAINTKFGLYRNLVHKVLFNSYLDSAFGAALDALPCRPAFNSFFNTFPSNNVTANVTASCGGNPSDKMYSTDCNGVTWNSTTIGTEFTNLVSSLGISDNVFNMTESPKSRCNANELKVLQAYNVYDSVVKCGFAHSPATVGYESCLETYWSGESHILLDNQVKVSCATCFTDVSSSVNGINATADGSLCSSNSFDSRCVANLKGRGLLNELGSCSGLDMSTRQTNCTYTDFAKLESGFGSIITYIVAAKAALANNPISSNLTSSNLTNLMTSSVDHLGNYVNITSLANVTCGTCPQALAMELAGQMAASNDLRNSCDDEYSKACLANSVITASKASFKKCSSIELNETRPFTCSTAQYNMIAKAGVNAGILAAVGTNGTTAASTLSTVLSAITNLETANNTTLPCKFCYSDLVTGVYALPDATKILCKAMGLDCVKLPAIQSIGYKYFECSGNVFNFTTPIDPNVTTSTTTPSPSTNSAITHAPVVTLIVAAIGVLLAL
jgi:hypothetical protein